MVNNLVANIGPCNRHLVFKHCSGFSQSFYPSFARTVLEQVAQTNSFCQQIRNTYLQFNCSSNLVKKFVSFDWRVHQAQSNRNRICSDNWSCCNACISLVKPGTLFEYQLKTAPSNIACKGVNGFLASLVSHWFSELETSDQILADTQFEFVMLSMFFLILLLLLFFGRGGDFLVFFLIFLFILLGTSVLRPLFAAE